LTARSVSESATFVHWRQTIVYAPYVSQIYVKILLWIACDETYGTTRWHALLPALTNSGLVCVTLHVWTSLRNDICTWHNQISYYINGLSKCPCRPPVLLAYS